VRALRDAAPKFGALPGIAAATLHRSLDGTRVVNYVPDLANVACLSVITGDADATG
jgi:hypothetical protein